MENILYCIYSEEIDAYFHNEDDYNEKGFTDNFEHVWFFPHLEDAEFYIESAKELELDSYIMKVTSLVEKVDVIYMDEAIHTWFELSYANWLTLPRLLMQSMSKHWQNRMVGLLEELDNEFDWRPTNGYYHVGFRTHEGKFGKPDIEIPHYRRGSVKHLRNKRS